MSVESNRANITGNRRKIFDLESEVMRNRFLAYETRAYVSENNALIRKNYEAAFGGNRQLANYNTDAAFRNRQAAVRNLPGDSAVHVNFREAKFNRTKLEFLDHRSKLNERVLRVSKRLADLNRQYIEIITDIQDGNEEIVRFNRGIIARNSELIENGASWSAKSTPDSNAALIAENSRLIGEIRARVEANRKRTEEVKAAAKRNREAIYAASKAISDRRHQIDENAKKIAENQHKVSNFVSKI